MENFGERLKELRLEKGLTQKQLANEIGNTQSAIVYWESNKQEPTISTLKKLCRFFNVSADYLLGLEDDFGARIPAVPAGAAGVMSDTITHEERTLIEKYRELNAPGKKLVRTVIDTQLATMDESKKNDIS